MSKPHEEDLLPLLLPPSRMDGSPAVFLSSLRFGRQQRAPIARRGGTNGRGGAKGRWAAAKGEEEWRLEGGIRLGLRSQIPLKFLKLY